MDRTRWPIVGHYFSNQYVIVYGQSQRDELESLGHFGRDLDAIKKKEDSKRSPEDRRILDLVPALDDVFTIILTIHEAFFLTYALGCLDVKLNKQDSIDIDTCWSEFRKYHLVSNLKIDFGVEFCVYYYFKTRGWVVKSGNNYGTNFLLYKGSPSLYHSLYAVYIVSPGDKNPDWQTVLTHHRVIQSVSKELLVVHVDDPIGVYNKPSCIRGMKIRVRKVACKSNPMA